MPSQSRSQRRRQSERGKGRPANQRVMTPDEEVGTRTTVPLAPEPAAVVRPSASTPARAGRRGVPRYTPEPVDYSKDYAHTRRDLRWIAIWSILLFVAMFVLKFSGIV